MIELAMLKMQNMVIARLEQKQYVRIKASSQTLDDDKNRINGPHQKIKTNVLL